MHSTFGAKAEQTSRQTDRTGGFKKVVFMLGEKSPNIFKGGGD